MIARLPLWLLLAVLPLLAQVPEPVSSSLRSTFEVRYTASGAVYLAGGREEGLQEGFRLEVRRLKPGEPTLSAQPVARLLVTAVAAHSAVCEIQSAQGELQPGDLAEVLADDLETLRILQQSKTARRYGQLVTFNGGDPLEQEQRDYVPHPPSPEVNRSQGRLSYEYNTIRDHTSGLISDQQGMVIRADVTRIAGSYWNITGYWRGRLNSRSGGNGQVQTLRDMMNRTYHIGLYYNNPESRYAFGAGRLLVPWAASLSTIDGAYLGRRLGRHVTAGVFGGSSPDPTAWDYKPGRQLAGSFLASELGGFERFRFTQSTGVAMSRLHWKAEREYLFHESTASWKQVFSVYYNLQADQLSKGRLGNPDSGVVLSRSFVTVRVQPRRWLSFDINHNYFRTIPTFDMMLVGTGLLDRFLFTGVNGGFRVDLPRGFSLYGTLGKSQSQGDNSNSLNYMYGLVVRNLQNTGFRVDLRRSDFRTPVGRGWYQSISLSRELSDHLRFEIQGGDQELSSPVSRNTRALWMNSMLDWSLTRHYILSAGWNTYRGSLQTYDQIYSSFGYRF